MTTAIESAQPGGEVGTSAPRAVVIGVMAGDGVQIGTLLDADAPVSVMLDPLLKVINGRLAELDEPILQAEGVVAGCCAWSTARRCGRTSR